MLKRSSNNQIKRIHILSGKSLLTLSTLGTVNQSFGGFVAWSDLAVHLQFLRRLLRRNCDFVLQYEGSDKGTYFSE